MEIPNGTTSCSSAHYGVSGPTIREAMRVLTAMGLVDLRSGSGALLGAVGVSGDRPEQDEECAVFGVESVGLVAQTD